MGLTPATARSVERPPWPATVLDQIAALKAMADAGAVSVEDAAALFTGAKRNPVARHLETLAHLGELRVSSDRRCAAFSSR